MRKLLLTVVLLAAMVVLGIREVQDRWEQPLAVPAAGYRLLVNAGDSLRAVVGRLNADGILAYPDLVIYYARWTGDDQLIKHGEYLLPAQSTAESLLQLLKSGKIIQYQVTLPEGIKLTQALGILAKQAELKITVEGWQDARILKIVEPYQAAEGLFFPDTYHFAQGTTDLEMLERAHTQMTAILEEEWQEREPDLPYQNSYDALIMASIIERETGLPQERGEIAGVFVRRLQTGMKLQTDPTVIYGLGEEFDGNLRRRHLTDETNPYNSYRHRGLPPTPIALPGRAAIHAALHPTAGTTLFFVARGDGGHVFSTTLAEHQKAVRKYQLKRRKDYRSSPEKP